MDKIAFDALWGHINRPTHYTEQVKEDLWQLLSFLSGKGIKRAVEVGTGNGGATRFWERLVGEGGVVITVEVHTLPKDMAVDFTAPPPSCPIHFLTGSSRDPDIIEKVKTLLGGGQIDFLFIDGDHTYEGCKADYLNYGPLVRAGGVIAFHDIGNEPIDRVVEEVSPAKRKWHTQHNSTGVVEL